MSKEIKHTPGPWTTTFGDSVITENGGCVADCVGAMDYETRKANARLIAAAPEMLEVLKTTAGNIRSMRAAHSCTTYDAWLEAVESAIKTAEGKSK